MYTLAALSADSFCKEELLIILVSEEDVWLCFSLTSEKDLLLVGFLLLLLLLFLVLVSFSSMTISSLLMSFSTLTLLTTVLSGFSVSWVLLVLVVLMLEKDPADLSCEGEEWEGGSGGGGEEGRGGGGELGREQDRPVGVGSPLGLVSGGGVGEGLEFLVIGIGVEFVGLSAVCISDKIGQEEELLEEGDDPL